MKKSPRLPLVFSLPSILLLASLWMTISGPGPHQLVPDQSGYLEDVSVEQMWEMNAAGIWRPHGAMGEIDRQFVDFAEDLMRLGSTTDTPSDPASTQTMILLIGMGLIGLAGFSGRSHR